MEQLIALIPIIPSMVDAGKSVLSLLKPLLKGLGCPMSKDHEILIREMEKRKDSEGIIDYLKKMAQNLSMSDIEQHYSGDGGTQVGINQGIINISPSLPQGENQQVKLSEESLELLKEISQDPNGTLIAIMLLGRYKVQTNCKDFWIDGNDVRQIALISDAIEELEQHGLIKTNDPRREMFKITHTGFNLADKL